MNKQDLQMRDLNKQDPREVWNWSIADVDLRRVANLRAKFLQPHPQGLRDYWESFELLASYHLTLGERIRWKWQAVLNAIAVSDSSLLEMGVRTIVDWGCGTGVASDAVLEKLQNKSLVSLLFFDRSRLAMEFCQRKAASLHSGVHAYSAVALGEKEVQVSAAAHSGFANDVRPGAVSVQNESALLLISHVLTELSPDEFENLLKVVTSARAVIWVEPGTPFCSDRLVTVRRRLLDAGFIAEKPCPHQGECGVLTQKPGGHWCHFYAAPDPGVFQNASWQRAAQELQIDLRALPVSFLFMRREIGKTPPDTTSEELVLGRIKENKGHSLLTVCSIAGLADRNLPHKLHKSKLRELNKTRNLLRYL